MTSIRRKLTSARRMAQRGFTLIELAIVGLFLGLLAIFAISQFSGSATDSTRANGLFEASTKIADNWALVAQSCGVGTNIESTNLSASTASTATAIASANLDMLLGVAQPGTNFQTCVNASGIRPLSGVATGGAGAQTIYGYRVAVANSTTMFPGRNTLMLTYGDASKYVPDSIVLPLYNKYSSVSGASTATEVPAAADTSDRAIQFGASTTRTMTLVKSL